MIVIGIDPGKTGAISGIVEWPSDDKPTRGVHSLSTMDRPDELYSYLFQSRLTSEDIETTCHIYVEQQSYRPRQQGVIATLTGYGEILTCCRLAGVEPVIVSPQAWKKVVLPEYKEDRKYPKEASIAWCEKNYPDLSLLVTDRCKKPSNDMADAVCIAEYGWRCEN